MKPHRDSLSWWKRPAYVTASAGLVLSLAFSAFVANTILTRDDVSDLTTVVGQLQDLAAANAKAIKGIEDNQAGINELVDFVRDMQNQPDSGVDVQLFIDLLCASEDPVRRNACIELGYTPGEVHRSPNAGPSG
jgi:hypothetical protein